MIGFIFTDGGRADAGFKGDAGDCVTRAIAIATGKPYTEVYKYLSELNYRRHGKKTARNGINKNDAAKARSHYGMVQVKLGRGAKLTFTEAYNLYGNCIVTTTRHEAAIVNGALRDTIDGRTYEWENAYQYITRERKAMSIWVQPSSSPEGDGS